MWADLGRETRSGPPEPRTQTGTSAKIEAPRKALALRGRRSGGAREIDSTGVGRRPDVSLGPHRSSPESHPATTRGWQADRGFLSGRLGAERWESRCACGEPRADTRSAPTRERERPLPDRKESPAAQANRRRRHGPVTPWRRIDGRAGCSHAAKMAALPPAARTNADAVRRLRHRQPGCPVARVSVAISSSVEIRLGCTRAPKPEPRLSMSHEPGSPPW